MSADRPDPEPFVDDRETPRIPEDAPLRDIVPDDFVARSGESTLREALKAAERATSRDADEMPRCPECLSVRIRRKRAPAEMATRREEAFKCANNHHFDEPAPSREAERGSEQATFEEVRHR